MLTSPSGQLLGYWGPRPVYLSSHGDVTIARKLPSLPRSVPLGWVWHWLPDGDLAVSFYEECLS